MIDIQEKELLRVRLRFFDLLKSFINEEPDAEKLSRWRGIFTSLATEHISPTLDSTILRLTSMLDNKTLQDLQTEFYQLFIDPYSEFKLNLNASFYKDGRNYGPSLVDFRQFLIDANLEFDRTTMEDDDSLLVQLDFMATLIEEEKESIDVAGLRQQQDQLINTFLLPTAQGVVNTVKTIEPAEFYKECLVFLCSYLDLERGLLQSE